MLDGELNQGGVHVPKTPCPLGSTNTYSANDNSMLYHTAVVHLFRPMLKVDLIHSDIRPRDTCIDAANQVSELLRLYRQHYGMRACQLVLTHILLSVCIVHLLYSAESQIAYRNLCEGLQALEDLSVCHYFGGRSFKIIHALAKLWNIHFPEELKDSKLLPMEGPAGLVSPPAETILIPPNTSSIASRMGGGVGYSPLPPAAQPLRRESLSMFAHPEHRNVQIASHPATTQGGSVLPSQPHHRGSHAGLVPSYTPSSTSTPQNIPTPTTNPSTTGSAETLFWTPVPGMGVPILPRNYQVSPMDLDNMLGNSDVWDKFSRDGFKMSDTWQQEPVNAYHAAPSDGYAQAGAESNGYNANPDAGQYVHGHDMNHQVPQHVGGQGFDPGWWAGGGNAGAMS